MGAQTAASRLLPLARERGVAVLINMPFGEGGLIQRLQRRAVPSWSAASRGRRGLLKFVLSHPALTCVIPGSGQSDHALTNALAGCRAIPSQAFWTDKLEPPMS